MSRPRHRPPWPLKAWHARGESIAHAACREWNLPCSSACATCSGANEPAIPASADSEPEASGEAAPIERLDLAWRDAFFERLGVVPQTLPFPPDDAPAPPRAWSDTDWTDE